MHKLLFDQNLSYKIIKHIERHFPNSSHVRLLGLETADDASLWKYAKENDYTIVTQDTDFDDLSILNGYPPKIIRFNIGNTSTQKIINLLLNKAKIIEVFLSNPVILVFLNLIRILYVYFAITSSQYS